MVIHYCDRCNREIKSCDDNCKITFAWQKINNIRIESMPPTGEICGKCIEEFIEWYKKGKNYGR